MSRHRPPGPADPWYYIPARFFLWSGVGGLCWAAAIWIAVHVA